MPRSLRGRRARILIADTNASFREDLVQQLRASGFEVVTASSGQSAFSLLRDWDHPVDWLYARADLHDLVDGWILADEFHHTHPHRAAVIAASRQRISDHGHVVLSEPTPTAVLNAIHSVATTQKPAVSADADPQSLAA